MEKTTLFFAVLLCIGIRLPAQTPFTETYFSPNHSKPTGEVIGFIRTPDRLFVHAKAPHGIPYARECMFAVDPEGQQVWNSFSWDFEPDSELNFEYKHLASDGSLYIVVEETVDISIRTFYLIKVHGGTGAMLWKIKIPDGQTAYLFLERAAGEISFVYRDAVFDHFLKTLSAQDGVVLRDQKILTEYVVAGIVALPFT